MHQARTDTNKSKKDNFHAGSLVFAAALLATGSTAQAQVELKDYADANGYIDVQKLTCAQLAGTYQEDADFLGIWYSGWYNGLAKKHAIDVPRTKDGILT
jgi:inactivated superfamily I helicase